VTFAPGTTAPLPPTTLLVSDAVLGCAAAIKTEMEMMAKQKPVLNGIPNAAPGGN